MPIRLAVPSDAVALESLIHDYLRESYPGHLGTPAATLRHDVLGGATTQRLVFIRGGAYDRPSTQAFYSRIAIVEPRTGETYLSARAFRHFATLAGLPARAIVRSLPPIEWNLTD